MDRKTCPSLTVDRSSQIVGYMTKREDEAYKRLSQATMNLHNAWKVYRFVCKNDEDLSKPTCAQANESLAEAAVEHMLAHREWLKIRGVK